MKSKTHALPVLKFDRPKQKKLSASIPAEYFVEEKTAGFLLKQIQSDSEKTIEFKVNTQQKKTSGLLNHF